MRMEGTLKYLKNDIKGLMEVWKIKPIDVDQPLEDWLITDVDHCLKGNPHVT